MEDILLMQLLKKKGIISDKDIHEFHELSDTTGISSTPVYSAKTREAIMSQQNEEHLDEYQAKDIVSKMYHIEGGRKYIGEKFDIYKAKEICERYRGILPASVTACEVYVAINTQYHDYIELFRNWFTTNVEQKIIESAISFWFKDADAKYSNKLVEYFKQY